jgi:uncharacterized membrane protein
MELKAKNASLIAKIVAGVIVIGGAVLKWLHVFDCSINEIATVAFTIAGLFGTVDINLMLEKIWGKADGNSTCDQHSN